MTDSSWLPRIDRTLCTGCGDCVSLCPVEALGKVADKATLVDEAACTYCTVCEDVCPVDAIELPFLICTLEFLENEHRSFSRDGSHETQYNT